MTTCKLKTSLKKSICTVSNFINVTKFHLHVICEILVKLSGVEPERMISSLEKEKENFCAVFTNSIKWAREIRKFATMAN